MNDQQLTLLGIIYAITFTVVTPLIFIGFGRLVIGTIAKRSGWSKMAELYPFDGEFNGYIKRFCSAQMARGNGYSRCLDMGVNEVGFYMVPMLLFRFKHPAVLVPWERFNSQYKKSIFGCHTYQLTLPEVRIPKLLGSKPLTITIPYKIFEELVSSMDKAPIQSHAIEQATGGR